MQPDLVGYLLNLLEPEARRAIEQQLESSPETRRQLVALRKALQPLEAERDGVQPPANLHTNTLKRVAAYRCGKRPQPEALPEIHQRPIVRSNWRRADVLIAASIGAILLLLIPPTILRLQQHYAVSACQNNLAQFHRALTTYAEGPGQNYYPLPERQGPLAVAGSFAPKLREANCWNEELSLTCPANDRGGKKGQIPPTPQELATTYQACQTTYQTTCRNLTGCYAYHLGYVDDRGSYVGVNPRQAANVPVLADRPPRSDELGPGQKANSPNHGRRGQNVLFAGGHVRFETSRIIAGDDIYLNSWGRLGAGLSLRDAVLATGEVPPFPVNQAD
jgi:prepilin-type processing-associated H-X9-DG protein